MGFHEVNFDTFLYINTMKRIAKANKGGRLYPIFCNIDGKLIKAKESSLFCSCQCHMASINARVNADEYYHPMMAQLFT